MYTVCECGRFFFGLLRGVKRGPVGVWVVGAVFGRGLEEGRGWRGLSVGFTRWGECKWP